MRVRFGSSLICALALALLAGACKRDVSETASEPSASKTPAPAPRAAPRCTEVPGAFSVGDRKPTSDEDGGDEISLPFAVEVGGAVSHAGGFAVAALRAERGGSGALLALVAREGTADRIVELGRTFGDAEPPRLAARGETLIAAVPDNDAGGGTIKLALLKGSSVTWGAEITQGRDESQVFDVELGKQRGLLVWDEWDKQADHGVVRVVSFEPGNLGATTRARALTPEGDDAEAPRLAPRPGGFWLAWISRQLPERHKSKPKDKPKNAKPAPETSGPPADDPVVDLGRRWLRIAPLDENGALGAEPRDVTSRQSHVLVFDLAPLDDGGALLAWRDDASSPGVEAGAIHLARIGADGSLDAFTIEDEKIGAGIPSLLVDPAARDGAPGLWLSLDSVTDATRLAALGKDGRLIDGLGDEPLIGRAEPLAIFGGRLLLARPRGLAVELSTARCRPGAPPDAAADGG
jgi:hypothetical protein